jgi:hypothetical protein
MAKLRSIGLAGSALLAASVLGQPSPARADAASRFAASLDHTVAVQKIRPNTLYDMIPGTDCTWYADLMVRQTGTASPDPDDATLVPIPSGGKPPGCEPAPGAGAIAVKTAGFAFVGRRGGFLIWDASDPNGAEAFMVMDAGSGKILFSDALSPNPGLARTATLESGVLHLKYTRGYNAACSLVQDTKGCWAKLVAAGAVEASAPPLTQAPASCRAAYKSVDVSDPSVVVFTTEVTVDASGTSTVLSRGPTNCLPQP